MRQGRKHTVEVAHVSLSLRSGSDVYPREVVVAEGQTDARDAIADPARQARGRCVDVTELPAALRERMREMIAEQEELGYDAVEVERIVLVTEAAERIRYRRDERPWRLPSDPRAMEQALYLLSFILWLGTLAYSLAY